MAATAKAAPANANIHVAEAFFRVVFLATIEGARVLASNIDKNDHYWDFKYKLAKCCKIENKFNQACNYYESLSDDETSGNEKYRAKAREEYYALLRQQH